MNKGRTVLLLQLILITSIYCATINPPKLMSTVVKSSPISAQYSSFASNPSSSSSSYPGQYSSVASNPSSSTTKSSSSSSYPGQYSSVASSLTSSTASAPTA